MDGLDLLLLAGKGIAVASLPLAFVWIGRAPRHGGDRLRRLAWVTAFFTFDLIVFGAFTRLTDSGLGCPDWPGCYAKANPFMATSDIGRAEAAMPGGPVTMAKAWIEMIHRYLAMAVGLLIVVIGATTVARRRRRPAASAGSSGTGRPAFPGMAAALLGLVVLQGAFGAWTVTQRLQPIFVATHLLLGMSLLAMLVWHALRFEPCPVPSATAVESQPAWLPGLAIVALVVLTLQIALGGWVSANYAVLACTDFPKCQGVWLPSMDFSSGFHPWRALGRSADGGYLTVEALTAIHWTHRGFAAVVLPVLGVLAWHSRRVPGLSRPAAALGGLLLLQLLSGLVTVLFAWPLGAAVLHNATAAGLVATLVVINYRLPRKSEVPGAVAATASPRAPLGAVGRVAH